MKWAWRRGDARHDEDGKLVVQPIRNVHEGWAEAAAAVAAAEEDPDEAAWMAFGSDGDGELRW